jgi:hypothetical protein
MSYGPLPADLQPYGAEQLERVIRPNGRHRPTPPLPAPEPAPTSNLLLRVRRLTWTEAEQLENDEPVPAARIRAWDAACELARQSAPSPPRRRLRLPGPLQRLFGGSSR